MLFSQRRSKVDKHRSTQLSFSTKFQRWNNIGSSTLNRRNSIDVVSTLFCQSWNNADKCTSAQFSFSTKYQRWNNVDCCWRSTLFQRRLNVDVFAGNTLINIFKNFFPHKTKSLTLNIQNWWTHLFLVPWKKNEVY